MSPEQIARARRRLGFPEAVRGAFAFLVNEFGLRLLRIEDTLAQYGDEHVFVTVFHGRRSYELGLEVGRKANSSDRSHPFTMGEIIGVSDEEVGRRYRRYTAENRDLVRKGLDLLAADLRRYGAQAIMGDDAFFGQLEEVRRRFIDRYGLELELSQVRVKAEAAWRARSYGQLQDLYESIGGHLTRLERARLAYARRHRNE